MFRHRSIPLLSALCVCVPGVARADGMGRCYCDMSPHAPLSIGVVMACMGVVALFVARRRRA